MKKISSVSIVFMFSAYAVCAQKQVLNSRTAPQSAQLTTQQPAKTTTQQQSERTTTQKQPAKYSTVEQASSQLRSIFPMPKKIMLLTKFKSLSLLSEKISPLRTMDNNISKNSSSKVLTTIKTMDNNISKKPSSTVT